MLATCEEKVKQTLGACEVLQREAEEANRKATIAEQQRDEVYFNDCKTAICLCNNKQIS